MINLFKETSRDTQVDTNYLFFKIIGNQLITLKPNTQYTLMFDKYIEGISTKIHRTHTNELTIEGYQYGQKFTFTTLDDVGNAFHVFIKGNTVEIAQQMLELQPKIIIIEGDRSSVDSPYFEGMQSVKMPVLTTTGKNLITSDIEMGNIGSSNGIAFDSNNHIRTKDYIKITPSSTVTLSNDKNYIGVIFEYDENYNFIRYTTGRSSTTTATLSNNCKFIKFRTTDSSNANDLTVLFQLEHGAQATSYEPFKSNILTVNEDVTLRSNGSVYDELNLLTRKLTQRIDEDGEVLAKEVVKTVDLTILDQNGQSVDHLNSFNGGTHVYTSSLEGSLVPSVDISVVTNLEETLKVCSLDGNTL